MAARFTVFPKFPSEIRDMIWAEPILGRVITIWDYIYPELDWEWNDDEARNNNPNLPHLTSSSTIPAIFQVCREARQVALRNYQVFFDERSCPNPLYDKQRCSNPTVKIQYCQNPFFFNPAVDTIFLPSLSDYESFMKHTSGCDETKLIRHLAICIDWHPQECSISDRYEELARLGRLENLENLVIDIQYRSDPRERFELRKQLRKFWQEDKHEEGDLEKKVVRQIPNIVLLEQKGMASWLSSIS